MYDNELKAYFMFSILINHPWAKFTTMYENTIVSYFLLSYTSGDVFYDVLLNLEKEDFLEYKKSGFYES